MAASILLIDDDAAIVRELDRTFREEGFALNHAIPGVGALRKLLIEEPDLVILGLNCQQEDWGYCRRLLTFLHNPLLLLLTTEDKRDRIKGLELGADDCMIKPVIVEEVVARTRALLRRNFSPPTRAGGNLFIDHRFVIDLACQEVRLGDQLVLLTPTEFRVLYCLVKHAGEVISPERLAVQVWGTGGKGSPETVKVYVHRLRQKLEEDPEHPQRILTRRGAGYLFGALRDPRETKGQIAGRSP